MPKLRLETVANWVIIVTGVVGTGTLAYRTWWQHPSRPAESLPPSYSQGEKLGTETALDYSGASKNLLIYVNSSCPYCQSLMPLIRQLTSPPTVRGLRIIVVGDEPTAQIQEYLKRHQAPAVQVVSVPRHALRIRLVPTMILADAEGRFLGSWMGQLTSRNEKELLAMLGLE